MMLKLVNFLAPASKVLVTRNKAADSGSKCVVILGWGGSKARNLTRVRSFYSDSEKVEKVVSFSMPLWAPEFVRKLLVRKVVDELSNGSDGGKGEVVIHAFSNNGTWVYGEICQELENRGTCKSTTKKLIIDSAPAFFYEHISLLEAVDRYQPVILSTLLNKDIYQHAILTPMIKAGLLLTGGAAKILYRLPLIGQHIVPDLIALSVYLRDECEPAPTLFIYGSEDGLIPPHLIEDFMGAWSSRVPIEKVIFESKHVASFWDMASRDVYRSKVSKFVGL